jgi:putative GTP pyrophosphokinase
MAKQAMAQLSKTQIDRLGDRLRNTSPNEKDIRLLNDYRRFFSDAYDFVITSIQQNLQLAPTGRPAKTIPSIVEKLRRESIRLSQIQDIAGCRIVVADIAKQDSAVKSLCSLFPNTNVMDRRLNPSHGYRAVHVITRIAEKLVEIQVRTELQHLWAEVSERCSDVYNPGLKYGIGDPNLLRLLTAASESVVKMETVEASHSQIESAIASLNLTESTDPELPKKLNEAKLRLSEILPEIAITKERLGSIFTNFLAELEKEKGQKQ